MTLPFQTIYPDEIKLPPARIESLAATHRERQRTGLIRLAYSTARQIYLLFRRGAVLNGYSVNEDSCQRLENWRETIASLPEAYARLIPLSTFALQLFKLCAEGQSEHAAQMNAIELRASLAGTWRLSGEPALYHLSWKTAEGLIFYAGVKREEYSVFFMPARLVDEPGITDSIVRWGDPQVSVTSFSMNISQPAWQEYFLRRTFADICERAFLRYEKITGRAVVDSAIRSLVVAASRQSAEINITGRQLMDREIFPAPQAAAGTYREILKTMHEQIAAIVGARLSFAILSEIVAELPKIEYQIARQFALLPEELYR